MYNVVISDLRIALSRVRIANAIVCRTLCNTMSERPALFEPHAKAFDGLDDATFSLLKAAEDIEQSLTEWEAIKYESEPRNAKIIKWDFETGTVQEWSGTEAEIEIERMLDDDTPDETAIDLTPSTYQRELSIIKRLYPDKDSMSEEDYRLYTEELAHKRLHEAEEYSHEVAMS